MQRRSFMEMKARGVDSEVIKRAFRWFGCYLLWMPPSDEQFTYLVTNYGTLQIGSRGQVLSEAESRGAAAAQRVGEMEEGEEMEGEKEGSARRDGLRWGGSSDGGSGSICDGAEGGEEGGGIGRSDEAGGAAEEGGSVEGEGILDDEPYPSDESSSTDEGDSMAALEDPMAHVPILAGTGSMVLLDDLIQSGTHFAGQVFVGHLNGRQHCLKKRAHFDEFVRLKKLEKRRQGELEKRRQQRLRAQGQGGTSEAPGALHGHPD
jgi:hypothetical protein